MSFIRCLSNPESLYIIDNVGGYISIWHKVKPPLSSGETDDEELKVSRREFYNVCAQWKRYHQGKYKDLTVKEEYIRTDTGEKVPEHALEELGFEEYFKIPKELLVKFQYKQHFFYMYKVTWMYVVNNVVNRHPKYRRKNKNDEA